nr:antibiotic biosynthesis monooxygenase [Azotobacter chroococcum]
MPAQSTEESCHEHADQRGFFTTQPGQGQALGQHLLALVGPTRQEPGCLRYDIYRASDSANS